MDSKVLIIGNGFDLNLGLKTKYSDFIKSHHFTNIERPNSFFSHVKNTHNLNNWVDVEIELKNYSKMFVDDNFESDYNKLCSSLIAYISDIDYSLINKTSSSYKLVKDLLESNFLVFDFNYTNTFFQLGKEFGFDLKDLESRIINIHGSAQEGKIIFGVEDEARIKSEHIFLKKSYPIHYKAISLSTQLKNATEVHFFGHSLGETDHTYFKDFFSWASNEGIEQDKRTLFLYYYDDKAYKDLHIQLDKLTNLSLMGLKHLNLFKPIKVQ